MKIRKSTPRDLDRIMAIYARARAFMAGHGNPKQWGPTNWPPERLIRRDIADGDSYVCLDDAGQVVGTFFFVHGPDIEPTYRRITDGAWLDDSPYGVVHRIASDGSGKGIGAFCLNWAYDQCGHLRIDTHGDNAVMQGLLKKLGFVHCGTIYVEEDDAPRLAYEKSDRAAVEARVRAPREEKRGIRIEKCTEADVAAVGAFYDRVVRWLDAHVNYPKWVYRVYPSEGSVREATAAGEQYVCLDGDAIAGAFVLNADPRGNYRKGKWQKDLPDGAYMVLHTLAVAPERQGRGLGSQIVRFCAERARSGGFGALRVDIVPDNHPAAKLYRKNGFTYAGDADLERGIAEIPVFSLYELNWPAAGPLDNLPGGVR